MRDQCPNCGSTSAFQEFEKDYFCHKCSFRKSKSKSFRKNAQPSQGKVIERKNWSTEFPPEALMLLFKNRITDDLIEKYDIRFDPNFYFKGAYYGPRIIFPSPSVDNIEFFEAKGFDHKVKYISYPNKKDLYIPELSVDSSQSLVIVEDIQSAIRVNETMPCVALRGTSFSDTNLQQILYLHSMLEFDTIKIWLDDDEAGLKGTRKLQQRLGLFFNIELIQTTKDPKCYSDEEIQKWLLQD